MDLAKQTKKRSSTLFSRWSVRPQTTPFTRWEDSQALDLADHNPTQNRFGARVVLSGLFIRLILKHYLLHTNVNPEGTLP